MVTRRISRRQFIRYGAVGVGSVSLSALLAACGGAAATSTTAASASTAASTAPPAPSVAPATAAPATSAAPSTAAAAPSAPSAAPASAAAAATARPAATPVSSAPAATPAGSGSGPTKLTGTPVPLVIYAAHGAAQMEADTFTKATGIPTKLVADSTGPLLAKIQAEINNPQWSLLWADGAEAFASLDQQGQLVRGYRPDVPLNDIAQLIYPKTAAYVPTGVTIMPALVYDSRTVPTPPTSWDDLLKPEWKGAVGMNNPAVSGPTYPFVAGLMQFLGGEEQGKAYFGKLKQNGLHVYTTNKVTLTALGGGEVKLALIQSSAAIGAMTKTPTLKVSFIPKASLLPSNIGINAKRPAQEQVEAKIFAEFVLSPAGQEIMKTADVTGDSLYYPLVNGVAPLPSLPPIASLPTQVVDAYVWGAKVNEINQWFTDNIAQ